MSARAAKLSAAAQELLPLHVAVIMDGNGRWAKERGLPRIEGHRRGAESARAIIKAASESGIRYLTPLHVFGRKLESPQNRGGRDHEILGVLPQKGHLNWTETMCSWR